MRVIRPNCRLQFTGEDIDFILEVLDPQKRVTNCLLQLLADPDSRDTVVESPALYQALLERPACVKVSSHFYFYVLVRQVLKAKGIADRGVADYVAELLSEFSSATRARQPLPADPRPMDYLVDMLDILQSADDATRFMIRAHVGNHSLFLSGLFPDHILARSERHAAPRIEYYENLGSASYRVAGHHQLAQTYHLTNIFMTLSEGFHAVRLALNSLASELLCLEPDCLPVAVFGQPQRIRA